jgi:hypothetical protein
MHNNIWALAATSLLEFQGPPRVWVVVKGEASGASKGHYKDYPPHVIARERDSGYFGYSLQYLRLM